MPKLPDEDRDYEWPHATVNYRWKEFSVSGKLHRRVDLRVMFFDAYNYQRELYVTVSMQRGDKAKYFVYRHPGRRNGGEIDSRTAAGFIERFLFICDKYPLLLFHDTLYEDSGKVRLARHAGLVHLSEQLLDGTKFTKRLLPCEETTQ